MSHNGGWKHLLSGLSLEDCPGKIVLLNGAPGSGKTSALDELSKVCGIAKTYTMSAILAKHTKLNVKSMTGLAGDEAACSALAASFRTQEDLILDGFPRSEGQVEFLKEYIEHVESLRTQSGAMRPKLDICMVLLNVDEETSVKRQRARQLKAAENNKLVSRTGEGTLIQERATDQCHSLCRERYSVFAQAVPALQRVEALMQVHHIDAMKSAESCAQDISSALIRHSRQRSRSPLRGPASTRSTSPGSLATKVSPWWEIWPTREGDGTDSDSRGWLPKGIVWS